MEIIRPQFDTAVGICHVQTVPYGAGFRKNRHTVTVDCENGMLLYHTLTGELLLLDENERDEYEHGGAVCTELAAKWFFVPENFNEMQYAKQVRHLSKLMEPKRENITGFTVFPTTDCNARCFYCFELDRKRIMMSEKTAHDTASFMLRVSGDKNITITWFGGEPLYNAAAIDIITGDLEKAGKKYSTSMISNSYLFDEETVKKAKEKWHLTNVQITLDGTEQTYNRIKAFIYKDGVSAFAKVMHNIELLLQAEIGVSVRLNLDRDNFGDLMALTDELQNRFAQYRPRFSVYCHLLFPAYKRHEFFGEDEEYTLYTQLNSKIESYEEKEHNPLHNSLRTNFCMADSDNHVTVLPDGKLGKCEHYTEDHFVGDIYNGITDDATVERFRCVHEDLPICNDCAYYPQCLTLLDCGDYKECSELDRRIHLDTVQNDVRIAYQLHLQSKNDPEKQETPVTESSPC